MNHTSDRVGRLVALLAALLTLATSAGAASAPGAERARLASLADRLLDAMAHHDAGQVPPAREYAATENGQPAALPMTALWRTVSTVRNRHYVVDPVTQQVFLLARAREGAMDTFPWKLPSWWPNCTVSMTASCRA